MFQGTEAHRGPQGIRETLNVVVVVSIILNPIFDFAESGVLCLPELSLHAHLFWWDIRLLIGGRVAFLWMRSKCVALLVKQLLDFFISFYVCVYFCQVEGMQHGTPYL